MSAAPGILMLILAALVAIPIGVLLVLYLVVPAVRGIGWLVRHVFRFVFGEIGDVLRLIGSLITGVVFVPLVALSVIVGRWSASAHYGRAVKAEIKNGALSIYRILIGHPARLLCLTALTDGIENRLPEVMAAVPTRDRPSRRTGKFEGYRIVGSLAGGGSGGKLYVAEPDARRLATFARNGQHDVGQVVIKSFSLRDGSSLPQIVRESRALDAAKKLGLVLEHDMGEERFYYVMRYVPGEPLGVVTQRLHAQSGGAGLGPRQMRQVIGYGLDLLRTLETYHAGGLWHKDVKPDNIIIDHDRARLVDLGLVTPLRSAMTLTTHGTEYFRDPEMVRLALKGVKVHEVDGAKFDIYALGAVLYSAIENSFPAHGGLSQITKPCPEAVRWVVRRAMTDYDKRYDSAHQMLLDLEAIASADDPYAVKPVSLPSVNGGAEPEAAEPHAPEAVAVAGSPRPIPEPPAKPEPVVSPAGADAPAHRTRPRIRVTDWWTGRYVVDGGAQAPAHPAPGFGPAPGGEGRFAAAARAATEARQLHRAARARSAREQLEHARSTARAARERARQRIRHRRRHAGFKPGINAGVVVALTLFFVVAIGVIASTLSYFWLRPQQPGIHWTQAEDDSSGGSQVSTEFAMSAATPPGAQGDGPAALSVAVADRAEARSPAVPTSARGPTVLLLSDLSPPLSEAAEAYLKRSLAEASRKGFHLVGANPALSGAVETGQEWNDLMADLILRRDLAPLGSSATRSRIEEWIGRHEDVNFVLWIGAARSGEDDAIPSVYGFGVGSSPATDALRAVFEGD